MSCSVVLSAYILNSLVHNDQSFTQMQNKKRLITEPGVTPVVISFFPIAYIMFKWPTCCLCVALSRHEPRNTFYITSLNKIKF